MVWHGTVWYGMVWHEARPEGPIGPEGPSASCHTMPYHTMPCHTIPYQYYHILILLYFYLIIYYHLVILLYIWYCSLFVVHAPIQHLGHLKDLILCIFFNMFVFCIFLDFLTSDADRNPTFLILLEIFEPLTQNYTFLIILLHRNSF